MYICYFNRVQKSEVKCEKWCTDFIFIVWHTVPQYSMYCMMYSVQLCPQCGIHACCTTVFMVWHIYVPQYPLHGIYCTTILIVWHILYCTVIYSVSVYPWHIIPLYSCWDICSVLYHSPFREQNDMCCKLHHSVL